MEFYSKLLRVAGGAFVLVLVVGCKQDVSNSDWEDSTSSQYASENLDAERSPVLGPQVGESISLKVGNEEDFQQLLQRHRGSVILVDYWATWCVPCIQQFPHTVALSERLRDQGLAVISISMNEPDEKDSVVAFLTRSNARFDHLLTTYGAGTQFAEAFGLRGDIPFYQLYDRQGHLRYSFSGEPAGLENGEPIELMDERIIQLLAELQEQPSQ